MLPSTGYFKSIICPFYESGCCDRPYCHFKHLRREVEKKSPKRGCTGDKHLQYENPIENYDAAISSTPLPVSQAPVLEPESKPGPPAVAPAAANAEIHQLVNEAVAKMLATQDVSDTQSMRDQIVAQVVEQLQPTIAVASAPAVPIIKPAPVVIGKHVGVPSCVTKPAPCVYNPTPIAELKKRHIAIPVYMPTRESKVAVKRKYSTETAKSYTSMLRESTNSRSEMTYKPTAIVTTQDADASKSYVPTSRSDNSSSNSYDDGNSNDYVPKTKKEAYYPKVKKRREEYVPKKVKAPLKNVRVDDNPFSDFDIMDEILLSSNASAAPANDDSQDIYDIEPKFSDDEEMEEEVVEVPEKVEEREQRDDDEKGIEEKENENDDVKTEIKENSHRSSHKDSSSSSSKEKSRRDSHTEKNKDKEKRTESQNAVKSDSKKESERSKKNHKDGRDKSKKDTVAKSDCKDKDKSKSNTRDKHRSSSSNKDRDRSKDSHSSDGKKEHRSKDTSKSHKDKEKVPGSKNDEGKSRSSKSRHDKHSSSSSKSGSDKKRESGKGSHEKRSSRSSSHKESKLEKKSSRKESSSERSCVELEERSNSPFESNFIDEELMQTSDSDHDVEEECLKIFQEYEPSDHPKGVTVREAPKEEPDDAEDIGRKRVAHPSAATSIVRTHRPTEPPKKLKDPQQRMYDRWRMMKEAAAEKAAEASAAAEKAAEAAAAAAASSKLMETERKKMHRPPKVKELNIRSNDPISQKGNQGDPKLNGNGRIRIAHVPYAMSLALEKKKVHETIAKAAAVEAKTAAQTSKGSRVAHIPQVVPQLVAPEPLQPTTQKFPLNVRQHYVNLMHVICVQIYTNGEDAAQRALREELACHDRCKALTVYKNSCTLATHRLRKEVEQGSNGGDALPSASGVVSHNSVLAGKSKGSWSVEKSKKTVVDFKGAALYERLKKWIMTEQQLKDNGFPRSHPDGPNGRAKIYVTNTRNQSILSKVPNERYCCRCNKPYMVNKHGVAVQQQNCIYHWGRKFTSRGESKYMCCQQYGFASGCADAKNHVWEYVDYDNLRGYVKTLPKGTSAEEQGVYALDCEMSYTTQGLELTRVTVIDEDCNTIYETLVMPENPIIDYNTRFSGITEENMKGVTTTLLEVQATLLTMFSERTILVGHSLESDFKALKLIHDTVVDTSMMFPHKNGPPFKRALRNLCSEYLRKIIQNEVGGHDSAEDAVACMELIHWKVKEEAKLQ